MDVNKDELVIQECVSALLNQYWILRNEQPDAYHDIWKHQKQIQTFFLQEFGYRFIITPEMAKVEKIPVMAEPMMGIQDFQSRTEYSLFVGVLYFLEERGKTDLFLISMLADEMKTLLSEKIQLKWELFEHRRALVSALQFAEKKSLIKRMEGNLEDYRDDVSKEVLYQPTTHSRHFMRYFSKPISEISSVDELLMDSLQEESRNYAEHTIRSLHRRLFTSPVVYFDELTSGERDYLYQDKMAAKFIESVEEYFDVYVECYPNEIFLLDSEKKRDVSYHPNHASVSYIVLQLASIIKRDIQLLDTLPNFEWEVTHKQFEDWVAECKIHFSQGWSSKYQEMSKFLLSKAILAYLEQWKLARNVTDLYIVHLLPPFVRFIGRYEEINETPEQQENNLA